MKCKFNIGDKVVVVDAKPARCNQYKNGDVGFVTQIAHVNHGYVTREDGVRMNVYWDEVEFYKEQPEESAMEQTAERIREDILHIEKRIEEAKKDIASMEEEKNVLIEKLKEKGFELVVESNNQQLKSGRPVVGDSVKITKNVSHHGLKIGEVTEIVHAEGGNYVCKGKDGATWLVCDDEMIKI